MNPSIFRRLVLGLACLGMIGGAVAETLTFQDAFDRPAGAALNAQKVGASQAAWEATPNVVLAAGGGIRAIDPGAFVGRLALPADAVEVTIEADIQPAKPETTGAKSPGWIGLGMGNSALGNPNFDGLLVLVYPNGVYSVVFNPEKGDVRSAKAVMLKSGRILSWKVDAMNRLKVTHNRTTESISVFANADEALFGPFALKAKSLTLNGAYGGFSGFGQASEGKTVGGFAARISK